METRLCLLLHGDAKIAEVLSAVLTIRTRSVKADWNVNSHRPLDPIQDRALLNELSQQPALTFQQR
jgi:hypothetical protein